MARTARSIWTVSAFVYGHVRDSAGVEKITTIAAMSSFNRMTPPVRHCERSAAIQLRNWIASSLRSSQ